MIYYLRWIACLLAKDFRNEYFNPMMFTGKINQAVTIEVIMANNFTPFETLLESTDKLSSAELETLQERIVHSRQKKISTTIERDKRNVFEIPYEEYLRLSDTEREAIQWRVYAEHHEWYEAELKARHAQWILVCGGKVLEFSRTLDDYPTPEKLQTLGREYGFIPFVFVPKPLIEESTWSPLAEEDFYPTLKPHFAARTQEESRSRTTSFAVDADFDTGSPHLCVDYDKLSEKGVLGFRSLAEAYFQQHLGEYYRFHIMPIQIAMIDENEKQYAKRMHAYCVRDWKKSPLCLVNPDRKALAGRNILLNFPLKLELDGKRKVTRIIGLKEKAKRLKKRK
jgi:hypothetical protein